MTSAYYGPNERIADAVSLQVAHSGAQINDGDYFTLSNGVNTVKFEFNNTVGGGDGLDDSAAIQVDFATTFTSGEIGEAIIAAINLSGVQSLLGVQATTSGGATSDISDSIIALHGKVAADEFGGLDFDPLNATGSEHLVAIVYGNDVVDGEDLGDSNRFIDQGQVIVQSTSVFGSSNFGIRTTATTDADGLSIPGPVRNLPTNNLTRQIPGVVLMNNLLVNNNSGGIEIVGGGNTNAVSAPFARVVNNTIFGGASPTGVGISISNGAAPTLMNNAISNTRNAVNGRCEYQCG